MLNFRIFKRGPIFDMRARIAARRGAEEAKWKVAERGLDLIDARLNQVLKTQTPYYRINIRPDRLGKDVLLHDRGIVYGPWLEGVSPRNRDTRFKGYHTFRIVKNQLQREAPGIADRVLTPYVRDMQ